MIKVKGIIFKSRKNRKIKKYQKNQEVRISSFIIQPIKIKNYVNYKKSDIFLKNFSIEDWKVKAKIIQDLRNYVKVKNHKLTAKTSLIKKDSIWSINKDAIN